MIFVETRSRGNPIAWRPERVETRSLGDHITWRPHRVEATSRGDLMARRPDHVETTSHGDHITWRPDHVNLFLGFWTTSSFRAWSPVLAHFSAGEWKPHGILCQWTMFWVFALNIESLRLKVVFQQLWCAFLKLLLFSLFSLGRCFFTQFQHESRIYKPSVFHGRKQAQHFTDSCRGTQKKKKKKSVTMHSLSSDIIVIAFLICDHPKRAPSWFFHCSCITTGTQS